MKRNQVLPVKKSLLFGARENYSSSGMASNADNADPVCEDVKVTCVDNEGGEDKVITIPKEQAEAIFESFDGKIPSELTFTWNTFTPNANPWDEKYRGRSSESFVGWMYSEFTPIRHMVIQQALFNLYSIHESLTSFDGTANNLWMMGDTEDRSTSEYYLRNLLDFHLTNKMMAFMFYEPFMKFVGAHCNKNVFCIYYRIPLKYVWDGYTCNRWFQKWILNILTYLGDNGTYNWICNLVDEVYDEKDFNFFEMTRSIMEYMIQSPQFAVFVLAVTNRHIVPKDIQIGTMKRKRE